MEREREGEGEREPRDDVSLVLLKCIPQGRHATERNRHLIRANGQDHVIRADGQDQSRSHVQGRGQSRKTSRGGTYPLVCVPPWWEGCIVKKEHFFLLPYREGDSPSSRHKPKSG